MFDYGNSDNLPSGTQLVRKSLPFPWVPSSILRPSPCIISSTRYFMSSSESIQWRCSRLVRDNVEHITKQTHSTCFYSRKSILTTSMKLQNKKTQGAFWQSFSYLSTQHLGNVLWHTFRVHAIGWGNGNHGESATDCFCLVLWEHRDRMNWRKGGSGPVFGVVWDFSILLFLLWLDLILNDLNPSL